MVAEKLSFADFLRQQLGSNWVIARRSPRVVKQYGEKIVCLSPERYAALEEAYERITGFAASGVRGEPSRFLKAAAHQMFTALQAAEATLAMCAGKLPDHAEQRRRETISLVRAALLAAQGANDGA